MKIYHKINQYLLENYPTIWNTKIVWMLLASLVIHLLFFVVGFLSHINPETLQAKDALNDYFTNGLVFVHLIISILMVVVWLVMMFNNNAFKNFYPNSRFKLFSQFFQYFVILLACTTFYFPYLFGLKLYINHKYDDATMSKKIETINRVAPFLSLSLEDYVLDQRKFPSEFSKLYCEQNDKEIDFSQKYFTFLDRNYQYYSTYSKTVYQKDSLGRFLYPEPENTNEIKFAYKNENDKSVTYVFKKKVEDLSAFIPTANPSYYNFSNVFYFNKKDNNALIKGFNFIEEDFPYSDSDRLLLKKSIEINKFTKELLDRNNPMEIEKSLQNFLEISKEFKIEHNLDSKSWLNMVYYPQNFEVKNFIKKYKDKEEGYDYANSENLEYAVSDVPESVDEASIDKVENAKTVASVQQIENPEDYFKARITNYYYCDKNLKNVLENIDEIKQTEIFYDTIHLFLWFVFGLSCLIFCFRITGLKSLLFSIVTTGLLALAVFLIVVIFRFSFENNYEESEFFTLYLLWFIGAIILLTPIFGLKKVKKPILGILINISICGFALYVLLHFGIINLHQKANCSELPYYKSCPNIFDDLGAWISCVMLFASFLFMYLYISIIQKWKALPS